MKSTRKRTQRTIGLSAMVSMPLALVDNLPPSEFQIFCAGDNPSEKGTFVFDDLSAEMVMAKYAQRGIPMMGDYEHQSTVEPPMEAPASIRSFVPQVRNGALWATQIVWTDRAAGYLVSGEYSLFSPAFGYEDLPDGRMRVTKLINVALTNNPALHNIEPLMAAKDDDMTDEELKAAHAKLLKDHEKLKAKHDDNEEEMKSLRAECKEMGEKLKKLKDKEPDGDEAKATAALRDEVKTITGKDDQREQIGVLRSIRTQANDAIAATTKLREIEQKSRNDEFTALLDAGFKDGKIAKAQREGFWDKKCKDGEKNVTVEGLAMLKDYLPTAPVLMNLKESAQREGGAGAPSREEAKVMERFGIRSTEDRTAFDKFRSGQVG